MPKYRGYVRYEWEHWNAKAVCIIPEAYIVDVYEGRHDGMGPATSIRGRTRHDATLAAEKEYPGIIVYNE